MDLSTTILKKPDTKGRAYRVFSCLQSHLFKVFQERVRAEVKKPVPNRHELLGMMLKLLTDKQKLQNTRGAAANSRFPLRSMGPAESVGDRRNQIVKVVSFDQVFCRSCRKCFLALVLA